MRTLIFKAHISLPVLPSRSYAKLHNVSVTPKMVKKLITNLDLDSSKASGLECFLVVVLNICDPERSYILAELFNMFLKESCFPDCWNVSLVVPLFKNVGERSTCKNYHQCHIQNFFGCARIAEKALLLKQLGVFGEL